jgi:hypothetical protein
MDTQREFEVRLFDRAGGQFLVVPVVAADKAQAVARAEALRKAHDGARYEVRGLMRSARYDRGADPRGVAGNVAAVSDDRN